MKIKALALDWSTIWLFFFDDRRNTHDQDHQTQIAVPKTVNCGRPVVMFSWSVQPCQHDICICLHTVASNVCTIVSIFWTATNSFLYQPGLTVTAHGISEHICSLLPVLPKGQDIESIETILLVLCTTEGTLGLVTKNI